MGTPNSTMATQLVSYQVGDYVEIGKKGRKGIIRFEGIVGEFGQCFGVELDAPIDVGSDGSFDGERFFECDEGKGTFVKKTRIKQKLDIAKRPKIKQSATSKATTPKIDEKESDKKEEKTKTKTTKKSKKGKEAKK